MADKKSPEVNPYQSPPEDLEAIQGRRGFMKDLAAVAATAVVSGTVSGVGAKAASDVMLTDDPAVKNPVKNGPAVKIIKAVGIGAAAVATAIAPPVAVHVHLKLNKLKKSETDKDIS